MNVAGESLTTDLASLLGGVYMRYYYAATKGSDHNGRKQGVPILDHAPYRRVG
jgi:hypothetical protein